MARQRKSSNASNTSSSMPDRDQELGSMYDYLAKIILLGPSGSGKSCLLHRFIRNEWRAVTSQTIGVEFASKIVRVGTGARRQRIKLQLWDTAGTERFRSVSRSYYRGAAGAILVYDLTSRTSFQALPTFLHDARALASPNLTVLLAGNKIDAEEGSEERRGHLLDRDAEEQGEAAGTMATRRAGKAPWQAPQTLPSQQQQQQPPQFEHPPPPPSSSFKPSASISTPPPSLPNNSSSLSSTSGSASYSLGTRLTSTIAPAGRAISKPEATRWASTSGIPVCVEVSALDGSGVDELFARLARTILTKIELGEIDPDDPASGIQYGDGGAWADGDGASVRSGKSGASANGNGTLGEGAVRRRSGWFGHGTGGKGRGKRAAAGGGGGGGWNQAGREWEDVFRLDGFGTRGRRGGGGGCC